MQAISPIGAVFGALADNMAKDAEEKRQQKIMQLQSNLALQRGLALQKQGYQNQKELNRQNITGQILGNIYAKSPTLRPSAAMSASEAFQQFSQGDNTPILQPLQAKEEEKIPLAKEIARFFKLPQGMKVAPREAEILGNQYQNYFLNAKKLKGEGRFVNIHGKNIPAGDLYAYLARRALAMQRILETGSPTGQLGANGKVQAASFPPEVAQDYLNKITIVQNKLALGEKLTSKDINFIRELQSPSAISASNAAQQVNGLVYPNSPTNKQFNGSLLDSINALKNLNIPPAR